MNGKFSEPDNGTSLFWAAPALAWQVLYLFIPLMVIVFLSLVSIKDGEITPTLAHYTHLLSFATLRIIARSLSLAIITSLICLIIAYPIAYFISFKAGPLKHIYIFFLVLPFWSSLLVLVYAWFFILETNGLVNMFLKWIGLISEPLMLLNTPLAVYIVMIYCYLPFMVLPLYTVLEHIDHALIEASNSLGASPLVTFFRVTLPLSISGIATGFFLVFIPTFGEFVIPDLMGGHKQFYAGSLISHYFIISRDAHMGAAFTCIAMGVLAVSCWMIGRLFSKKDTVRLGVQS